MTNKGFQDDITKLKSDLQDIFVDVKWLSQKFKINQKKMQDIVEENKVLEQKLDESNTKMLVVLDEVSNLKEKAVVVDPECNGEWDFSGVDLNHNNTTEDIIECEVEAEKIAAVTSRRNDRVKISVVTLQCDHQEKEALIQASSRNFLADDEFNKENEVLRQMSKFPNQDNEKPSKSLQQSKNVVSVDKSNNEKEKCGTTKDVRRRKSYQMMMNPTESSKQTQDSSRQQELARRTKSVLNQSVIDCEHVLKKRVVKEKQVMTPMKIKTEAANPLDLFQCNFCTKSFTSAAPLAVHLKNHSRGTEIMDCPFLSCNHRGNQLKLTQHMRSKHTREKLFTCYSCPAKFASLDAKTAHEKKHSVPSLQQCGKCSRFFSVERGSCRCC